MLTRLLRRTERTSCDRLLIINKNNLKKTWSIIKDVINKKKKSSSSSKFIINGSTVTDNITIARHFNKYFVNVASELASKIPKSKTDPTKTLKKSRFHIFGKCLQVGSLQNNFVFKNSSPGWDNFQSNVVKDTSDLLLLQLTHLLNLSITQRVFPDELKIAKIILIFKSGDSAQIGNYRPVSVLPFFSKVFERVMYVGLFSFIKKYDLLYKYQFGFRQGFGTDTALVFLIDKILKALDEGEIVLGVL